MNRLEKIISTCLYTLYLCIIIMGIVLSIHPDLASSLNKDEKRLDVHQYREYAKSCIADNRAEEAIDILTKALELDNQNGDLYLEIGKAYMSRSDFDRAEFNFKKALGLNITQPDIAYGNIGLIYEIKEDIPNARQFYKRASELALEPSGAYLNISKLYLKQFMPDSAKYWSRKSIMSMSSVENEYISVLKHAKNMYFSDSTIYSGIDSSLSAGFDFDDYNFYDIQMVKKNKKNSSNYAIANMYIGVTFLMTFESDSAMKYIETAYNIAPNDEEIKSLYFNAKNNVENN